MDEDENTLDDISGDEVSHLSLFRSNVLEANTRRSGDVGTLRRNIIVVRVPLSCIIRALSCIMEQFRLLCRWAEWKLKKWLPSGVLNQDTVIIIIKMKRALGRVETS